MKTLLLIDAYAMIYRAYYAFIRAPRMNSRGENTSAIFGFVVTFEDLLKRLKPSHIAVAFDPAGPTFRHEAFEQYKAQRQETPEDIRWAVPRIKQSLQAMNVPVLEVPGYEADDVIGTISHKAEKEGFEVYMATPDKDYGQLVTKHIFMYRPRHTGGFEKLGPQEVCEKYGLQNQSQVIDLLGLMGDSSDNIPGCKGVGEKTAVQLLQQFGSIDNLLANTDQLKGALQRKVQEQVEEIRFSRFLATIKTDVPIEFDAQSLVYQERNWDLLAPLYRELEFNSLLKQAPASIANSPSPITKSARKAKPQEATLDLFADLSSTIEAEAETQNSKLLIQNSQIEERLATYLLNPEVAFNPEQPVNWDALKADTSLWNLYQEVELPLSSILREMEQAGVRIDVPMLRQAEMQLNEELQTLEQQIYTAAGVTFNINSPKQVGEVLFDQLHLDSKAKKSKNGQYSTSEEVLLRVLEREYRSLYGRNLTLSRLPEAVILPLCPDKGTCLHYDPNLAPSVYLENDLEQLMQKHPELKLKLVGHTSSEGDATFNQKLSEARAQAAVDFLVGRGVDASRLSAEGKGSSEPIDENNPEANRRTEFIVIE